MGTSNLPNKAAAGQDSGTQKPITKQKKCLQKCGEGLKMLSNLACRWANGNQVSVSVLENLVSYVQIYH